MWENFFVFRFQKKIYSRMKKKLDLTTNQEPDFPRLNNPDPFRSDPQPIRSRPFPPLCICRSPPLFNGGSKTRNRKSMREFAYCEGSMANLCPRIGLTTGLGAITANARTRQRATIVGILVLFPHPRGVLGLLVC